MARPNNLTNYGDIDLKLGIKSSLPHIKSTVALSVLLWLASGKQSVLYYSSDNGNGGIECNAALFNHFYDSYNELTDLDVDRVKEIVNQNQLFKSQCEALIVAFELVFRMARFSFTDGRPFGAERTGGQRYEKKCEFTTKMDILDALINHNQDTNKFLSVLLNWMGIDVINNDFAEQELALKKVLTVFTEDAIFKIMDNDLPIIFDLCQVYKTVLQDGECELSSEVEPKGPFRVLRSIISDSFNYYISTNHGSFVGPSNDELSDHVSRLETHHKVTPRVQINEDGNIAPAQMTAETADTSAGKNVLLYGVPGCGKSYTIQRDYCNNDALIERVVFHPDYTYSDFVGQILPKITGDRVTYEFQMGPFTRILKKAYEDPDNNYYLIIEEINRGNAPAIFGDIFQLLDRDENGTSEYGITNENMARAIFSNSEMTDDEVAALDDTQIKIPSNLFVLATMNTADQNVFTLDTAFKRRWNMESIKNEIENCEHANICICDTEVTWLQFASEINNYIIEDSEGNLSSEDNRLGAWFVKEPDLHNAKGFAEKVLMYLWNDAFKFSRDKVFKSEFKTLDDVIDGFIAHRFYVFTDTFGFANKEVVSNNNADTHDSSVDEYLAGKNPELVDIYSRFASLLLNQVEGLETGATNQYIKFSNGGRNIAEIHILTDAISIHTKQPSTTELQIGELVPDNYGWALNYKIHLTDENMETVCDAIINANEL